MRPLSITQAHVRYHEKLDAGVTRGLRQAYERWAAMHNQAHPENPLPVYYFGEYEPGMPEPLAKNRRNLCPVCWNKTVQIEQVGSIEHDRKFKHLGGDEINMKSAEIVREMELWRHEVDCFVVWYMAEHKRLQDEEFGGAYEGSF